MHGMAVHSQADWSVDLAELPLQAAVQQECDCLELRSTQDGLPDQLP